MKIGVVLMTYGSPKTLGDIPEYLKNVYGGKEAGPEVIKEFRRRYDLIGGSPLVKITQDQAAALEKELNKKSKVGDSFRVMAGMRFSPPFIKDVVFQLQDVDEIIGIIMSPQYSPIIMKGYINDLEKAVVDLNREENLVLKIAKDWHLQPYFLEALAERVKEALDKTPEDEAAQTPVLFSAHSMPKRVIEKEPSYIDDLKETASEVAKTLELKDRWMFCYQSAGHTPEEWLKPDFADLMPEFKKQGYKSVLIAPIQFLADHLEILYDIEIGAREQAEENGLKFYRTESLNTSLLFIKALAGVVGDLHQS
jgi:protoporphyrin/coproporphyrin ferrochelatase